MNKHAPLGFIWAFSPLGKFSVLLFFLERRERTVGCYTAISCELCYLIARKSVAGISMEGDEELLAQTEVKVEPKRDEWMTTLPPERKVSPVDHLILCTCANYTKCSRT